MGALFLGHRSVSSWLSLGMTTTQGLCKGWQPVWSLHLGLCVSVGNVVPAITQPGFPSLLKMQDEGMTEAYYREPRMPFCGFDMRDAHFSWLEFVGCWGDCLVFQSGAIKPIILKGSLLLFLCSGQPCVPCGSVGLA